MSDLSKEKAQALSKGTPPMEESEAKQMLTEVVGWELSGDGKAIQRSFKFKDYYHTIAFVNAVAWIANQQDHHPDMEVSYNRCAIQFSTHSIGGISRNDFICAAQINALVE